MVRVARLDGIKKIRKYGSYSCDIRVYKLHVHTVTLLHYKLIRANKITDDQIIVKIRFSY